MAAEAAEITTGLHSTRAVSRRFGNARVTDVRVDKADARRIGKAAGRYITIEGEPTEHAVLLLLRTALEQLLPREGQILVAGLGNPDIARDSLGARTVRLLRGGMRRQLAAMETDVATNTGIETARMVRGVAKELKVSCVIAVDALACCDPKRIGRTVQISDTGLQPGSGVHEDSVVLSRECVGVPVIAVGVPMVSELSAVTGNIAHRGYLAASANEDEQAQIWADVIAAAINELVGR